MSSLLFKKHKSDSSRFGLMVSAKVKELIEYYGTPSLLIFQKEFNEWITSIPRKNAYSIDNKYRLKVTEGKGQIWMHFMGSDKEPVLAYEICEEVCNEYP